MPSRNTLHMLLAATALVAVSDSAYAIAPINVATTAGTATITHPTATSTQITQTSEKAVYRSTNLNAPTGYTLNATVPDTSAISLFIVSGGKTTFNGNLTSNGKVWIINPDGMMFGGATVNTAGLLLSTAGLTNPEGNGFFTNSSTHYDFDQAGSPTASIVIDNSNFTINGTPSHGDDILIQGPQVTVTNNSHLTASRGNVTMLGGETFTADFTGDGLINFQVITGPITQKSPGATSSIEVDGNSSLSGARVTAGAIIFQDAVLDHVINLGGQYEVGTYNKATNPDHVNITPNPIVYETIIPQPVASIVPTSAITPQIRPLTRVIASLSDESVKNPVVDPNVSNDSYQRPYPVSVPASLASGALNLLSPSAGGGGAPNASPTNLGNLSPSAGGNVTADAQNLGNLSPSAGGVNSSVNCANAYLDSNWNSATPAAGCAN